MGLVIRGIGRGLALLMMASIPAGASSKRPKLPKNGGFITRRPAQKADVKNGDAVFVASENGKVVGEPILIRIPQRGYHRALKKYVIVVQAEEALGIKMLGVRDFKGTWFVTLAFEVKLLRTKPRK
jgi:hypothetical protein